MADKQSVDVGDVLAVRTPTGIGAWAIRFGAALEGKPNLSNHIIVVHHKDPQGHWWGLQGQPGGVGWAVLDKVLADRWTVNNVGQPDRTSDQRINIASRAEAMLGTKYDWESIEDEVIRAFAPQAKAIWDKPWDDTTGGTAPGHVICSAYAAYLYDVEKWNHPGGVTDRECEPADWDEFMISNGYNVELS